MTVSGVSFVRNAVALDYPVIESITSILPLCDEFVIAVGTSDDDTLGLLRGLNSPKLVIIETTWDETLREGGAVLAQQTNIALNAARGDWLFYLQADEVVHERDLSVVRAAMTTYQDDGSVEGLVFDYKHFYGDYNHVGNSRQWYRREVRVVRNGIGVASWGDAQGFRINGRKLNVKRAHASIFHYGWVKPPVIQQRKQQSFNKLWHPDDWVKAHVGDAETFDYSGGGELARYQGSHPAVMHARIANARWEFVYEPHNVKRTFRLQVLRLIERFTGWRIGEYRNFVER